MTPATRPNPEALLARIHEEARQEQRGRLKVFFGAAPGVGKTFAMLEAAHLRRDSGVEVVVGVVETHKRQETEALLKGFEILPRRRIPHRGITLEEFDLDGALARRPGLLLVDELAHTNAPGSRHLKRWKDVLELIDAGIDVYTTLNVQHLDSLNDVVAQITGVQVRETVPDSVLDQADEIELVDLPVSEHLRRLEEGKVYLGEQAARARDSFFRPGNLIALREMALRRTADRVDAQMRSYRANQGIQPTWPVAERILVSIGPSPYSAKLIRAAKRLAERLQAEWIVAFVETPAHAQAPPEARERVLSSLRLAEQLGAETVTIAGTHVAACLIEYARSRNVSRIVMGKQAGPLWLRLWRGSVLDEVIGQSGDIAVTAISGEPETGQSPASPERPPTPWQDFIPALVSVTVCTLISLPLRGTLNPVNLVMFYLLGVTLVAVRSTRRVALAASLLSVAAFDFFCVPPYLTFAVSDYQYILTFIVMLIVSVIISTLTVRIRSQAAQAADREARTKALYRLTRELAGQTQWFEAARQAASISGEVFAARICLFFPGDPGVISFRRRTSDDLPVPASEEGIAQWVYDHAQNAGLGMDTLPGAQALYLPLRGSQQVLGVMAVVPANGGPITSPEQFHLLEIFAGQSAQAIERAQATAAARQAHLQVETEKMRSTLLSAVSHDLRTPLASITGAATSLLDQGALLPPETHRELLESIATEADRLNRLVHNLLEMTRLESGSIQLQREFHPLEEITGVALARLERPLAHRSVSIRIPPDLPLVWVDDVLLGQLLVNLLDNACKYTPAGSPIEVRAFPYENGVMLEVADSGPGFPPGEENLIWDKFYRGKSVNVPGAGLGLAISRAIAVAHGGRISAANRPEGGAVVGLWLPPGPKTGAGN